MRDIEIARKDLPYVREKIKRSGYEGQDVEGYINELVGAFDMWLGYKLDEDIDLDRDEEWK